MLNRRGVKPKAVVIVRLAVLLIGGCSGATAPIGRDNGSGAPAIAGTSGTAMTATGADASDLSNTGNGTILPPVAPSAGTSGGAMCAPGHYTGTFSGSYHSGAWFGGSMPIDFATSDNQGKPGFEFWLEAVQQACPPNNEFCPGATVKGGKLRGFANPFTADAGTATADSGTQAANPFALSVRFEIDLSGDLDCTSGTFRGQLQNGCYDIASVLFRFSGSLESSYDSSASAFKDGTWMVTEMAAMGSAPATGSAGMPAPARGGGGVWGAKLTDTSTSPTTQGPGLCSGMSGFDTPAQ